MARSISLTGEDMTGFSDVIVIGAGVIGLSAANALQMRGRTVTVIDREGPAAGASAGNAAGFAFSDILPLASPGILKKAPKWLLDPLGPLAVRPSYALKIAPWMYRFWRACSPKQVAHSTTAQTRMMDLSRAELEPFLHATDTHNMLRKYGALQVYEGEAEFQASMPGWQAREDHGIPFQHLDAAGMAEVQPGLAPRFTHGTLTPGWFSIADPKLYVLALAERFLSKGGQIDRGEVSGLEMGVDGVTIRMADGSSRKAGQVVLCAGAFSHRIARSIGDRIPLETERGYNTTLPSTAFDLRTHIVFGGHGFMVSRLDTGIRVGGAVELGGLSLPPNYKRAEAMLKKAQSFLPGLSSDGGRQWMGFRPSLPDTLPVIGHSTASDRIVYAFGHGHLGLTQSSGTARLVADLVTGRAPAIDISNFSPKRF